MKKAGDPHTGVLSRLSSPEKSDKHHLLQGEAPACRCPHVGSHPGVLIAQSLPPEEKIHCGTVRNHYIQEPKNKNINGMRIKSLIHVTSSRILIAALALVSLSVLSGCDSYIYDSEGDCSVTYRLKFRYDLNLKWADAFASEVKSVHVYAFNADGILVWQKSERGASLGAPGYAMTLDLPAGDYHLIAWCGLDNEGGRHSFSVPEMTEGVSRKEELLCRLKRYRRTSPAGKADTSGEAYIDESLDFLFHGMLDVSLPEAEDGGIYDYTIPLTKDTNHLRIILQHLSAQDVDVNEYTFRIEDDNGLMSHDNRLVEDEPIVYNAWKTQEGTAGIISGGVVANCKTAVADITVARMTEGHAGRMFLVISRKDGETIARVPVIDYALLSKDYYEEAYGHKMTPQEFLDREDEYVMTFFLDESHKWMSSYIMVHSWKVVVNNADIK